MCVYGGAESSFCPFSLLELFAAAERSLVKDTMSSLIAECYRRLTDTTSNQKPVIYVAWFLFFKFYANSIVDECCFFQIFSTDLFFIHSV